MNIKFKVKNTNYLVTSDSMNFILKVERNPKLTTYYSTIGGVLESVYQVGLKDNSATSFRDLAKHSEEIQDSVSRVENQFKQVSVRE